MLYPLILRDDADGIISRYRGKFLKAKKPQERVALWQNVIHEFRIWSYLWHLESEDCIGRVIWWITPKHTKYVRGYEVCQGVVTDVDNNVFFVQAGKKNVTVRMKHLLAISSRTCSACPATSRALRQNQSNNHRGYRRERRT